MNNLQELLKPKDINIKEPDFFINQVEFDVAPHFLILGEKINRFCLISTIISILITVPLFYTLENSYSSSLKGYYWIYYSLITSTLLLANLFSTPYVAGGITYENTMLVSVNQTIYSILGSLVILLLIFTVKPRKMKVERLLYIVILLFFSHITIIDESNNVNIQNIKIIKIQLTIVSVMMIIFHLHESIAK